MGFNESAALFDLGFALVFVLVFGVIAFASFRSNRKKEAIWKKFVGGLAVLMAVSGIAGTITPVREYAQARNTRQASQVSAQRDLPIKTTVTTQTTATTSTTTTLPTPWRNPARRELQTWAESAVSYLEATAGGTVPDFREEMVPFVTDIAERSCRMLTTGGFSSVSRKLNRAQGIPDGTLQERLAAVEAEMRMVLGVEGWELVGEAWYDSLVNGVCIRR